MKKIVIALMLLPLAAATQTIPVKYKDTTVTKTDTIKTALGITRCNTCPLQPVPGYVLMRGRRVVGFLSKEKKLFPKKITVWSY